jgi:type IV secretory pathway TraG/TraD family ATPase VirD4
MRRKRVRTPSPLGSARDGRPFSYDGSGNPPTLIFGLPDRMKSVPYFINELLNDDGQRSYLVLDPKGELAAMASERRRKASEVKLINPYGVSEVPCDSWNPLGDLDGNQT